MSLYALTLSSFFLRCSLSNHNNPSVLAPPPSVLAPPPSVLASSTSFRASLTQRTVEMATNFHGTDREIVRLVATLETGDKSCVLDVMDEVIDFSGRDPCELVRESRCQINGDCFLLTRLQASRNRGTFRRKTRSGSWKSTGPLREMKLNAVSDKSVTKRTLVFRDYRRSPGEKTEWVAHEFRLNYGPEEARNYAIYRVKRRGDLKDEDDVQLVNEMRGENLRRIATAMLS